MSNSMPLVRALREHLSLGRISFHTPGHKGLPSPLDGLGDLKRLDLTELPDTDSLYEADGPIAQAMELAAGFFHAKRTLFSSGGCTLCIQAMLYLAAPTGGKVIFGRTLHRSAVNAMALLDITPVWVLPRPDAGSGLPGRIHPDDVEDALLRHPDAKAVYVTSPDYYGTRSDIASLAAVCRRRGVLLLVDNAHGAHFSLLTPDIHPLHLGADACADSAHKTLPVLTGGAWLQLGQRMPAEGALDAMALFGSTSPSYPIMASLDLCRSWMQEKGNAAFSQLQGQVEEVKKRAEGLGIPSPKGPVDPVRLAFNTLAVGVDGRRAAEHLRLYGIEPEMSDKGWVVLLPSPFHEKRHLQRLMDALTALPHGTEQSEAYFAPTLPEAVERPRAAVLGPSQWVDVEQCVGRVAAQAACPCPPGVPLVMPGEKIDQRVQLELIHSGIRRLKVVK
ncbi:Arginine decarboxylase [Eubacteriaceae bacterium CHKCI005]|nr:Arginine decarboxylase [Eubacteriaceae bacterium CHKCI005]